MTIEDGRKSSGRSHTTVCLLVSWCAPVGEGRKRRTLVVRGCVNRLTRSPSLRHFCCVSMLSWSSLRIVSSSSCTTPYIHPASKQACHVRLAETPAHPADCVIVYATNLSISAVLNACGMWSAAGPTGWLVRGWVRCPTCATASFLRSRASSNFWSGSRDTTRASSL